MHAHHLQTVVEQFQDHTITATPTAVLTTSGAHTVLPSTSQFWSRKREQKGQTMEINQNSYSWLQDSNNIQFLEIF
jgi:hypothetical protein